MKKNYIHVCFVIDKSGSMSGSEKDVIGGFKTVIDEQKANTNGTCSVSYYKFDDNVEKMFIGKDINEVEYLTDKDYKPGGCTALFDGVGTAIDEIGAWLDSMKEEDKPEKNIIVIMTDGGENSSKEYNSTKVKEMIKHQEDKYNWTFIYMGSDLKDAADANTLGVKTRLFAKKCDYASNYTAINSILSTYRNFEGSAAEKNLAAMTTATTICEAATAKYAADNGLDANDLLDNSKN
jgi:uncharacterized protein YegL